MGRRTLGYCLIALALGAPACAAAQSCADPHFRWPAKTDATLATETARRGTVWAMLNQWQPLEFTGEAKFRCADRTGLETRVYSVLGWVRRVRKGERDGDWHFELTSRPDSPVGDCIVAEIPSPEFSALFRAARESLDRLVAAGGATVASNGDVSEPVRVRVVGPAFFDGEHRGGAGRRDRTDGAHGRCNSSDRALWEIHPVYWIVAP